MTTTLLLDRANWDLALDANGNIAVADDPYSMEQDVASECRVFEGECYYDTTRGIAFFDILGRPAPVQLLKQSLVTAAKRVPGVGDATVYLNELTPRSFGGQVQFSRGVATI